MKKESVHVVPDIDELEKDKGGANNTFDTANDPNERDRHIPEVKGVSGISVGFKPDITASPDIPNSPSREVSRPEQ